jgi:hypothetical protein
VVELANPETYDAMFAQRALVSLFHGSCAFGSSCFAPFSGQLVPSTSTYWHGPFSYRFFVRKRTEALRQFG